MANAQITDGNYDLLKQFHCKTLAYRELRTVTKYDKIIVWRAQQTILDQLIPPAVSRSPRLGGPLLHNKALGAGGRRCALCSPSEGGEGRELSTERSTIFTTQPGYSLLCDPHGVEKHQNKEVLYLVNVEFYSRSTEICRGHIKARGKKVLRGLGGGGGKITLSLFILMVIEQPFICWTIIIIIKPGHFIKPPL